MLREGGASSNRRCLLDRPAKPGDDERERTLTAAISDPLDDYIDAVGKALALPIDDAWRPAVKANLEVSLRLARLVDEFHCPTKQSPPVSLQPDIAITATSDDLSAAEIAQAVASRKMSAAAATEAALARIAKHDAILNSFTDVTAKRARAKAKAIDAAVAAGKNVGPLAGVPFAVKNLFDVQGLSTRAGSKINRDLKPSLRDATLIERMEAAGAVLVGALNMGEYAYDFTGENVHDGPSRNPHDPTRMTGGSSGGSGSAVGGGLVPLALGSDTNGSIRVPSSFCGIFGLKPTYGRLSRARSFPFVASFDHLGPFARNVGDLALAYDAMQGPDTGDAACTHPACRAGERAAGAGHQRTAHCDCRRLFPEERFPGSGRGRIARDKSARRDAARSKFPRPRAPAPRPM